MHESLGSCQQVMAGMKTATVYERVLLSLLYSSLLSSLISLGKKVFYVGVKLVICVYVNVLKVQTSNFTYCIIFHKWDLYNKDSN